MSVIALSKEHFEAVYAGLWSPRIKNNWFFGCIKNMSDKEFVEWIKQLNRKNQREYNERYSDTGVRIYRLTLKLPTLSDTALLKACQAIAYNSQEDDLLREVITALKEKIIYDSEEYKLAKWTLG